MVSCYGKTMSEWWLMTPAYHSYNIKNRETIDTVDNELKEVRFIDQLYISLTSNINDPDSFDLPVSKTILGRREWLSTISGTKRG